MSPFTSSTGIGEGALGNITVTGNTISNITLTNRGKNYKIGDKILTTSLSQSFYTNKWILSMPKPQASLRTPTLVYGAFTSTKALGNAN